MWKSYMSVESGTKPFSGCLDRQRDTAVPRIVLKQDMQICIISTENLITE